MRKKISAVVTKIIMVGLTGLLCMQAEASTKKCLKGTNPTEQEMIVHKAKLAETEETLKRSPEKMKQYSNEAFKMGQVSVEMEIPRIDSCIEYNFSELKLKEEMEKFHILTALYPDNLDYIYNSKILNSIMFDRAFK